MTAAAPDGGRSRLWSAVPYALLRGALAFVVVAIVGVLTALAAFVVTDPGISLSGALRLGVLYLGPFHRVPVVVEGELDVDMSRIPGSELPREGAVELEVGFALLAVTALALWLLFRAGRAAARRAGGSMPNRALVGASIAPGYAVPIALVALMVTFREPVTLGSFVTGEVAVRLSAWALVVPLGLAALAGAAGGAWSRIGAEPRTSWSSIRAEPRTSPTAAVLGGGWRMLWFALGLSYLGLLLAGVVQPDRPVALLTPSTARYFASVFERPGPGAVVLAHHLAASPNEAAWALVPAMGGCDVVQGDDEMPRDLVCITTARTELEGRRSDGERADEDLPTGYLLFALAPAAGSLLGGRWAVRRAGAQGWPAVGVGALAGVTFAALVAATSLLATISMSWEAAAGARAGGGELRFGPDVVEGTLLALGWGVLGGSIGAAASVRRRSSHVPA